MTLQYNKTSDFYYDLPEHLIAQKPLENRSSSKLMCLEKNTGKLEHRVFNEIVDMLNSNDILVINSSKVMPCRILGEKNTGTKLEILLLKQLEGDIWECIVRPGKVFKKGSLVEFCEGLMKCEVLDVLDSGNRIVKIHHNEKNVFQLLDKMGTIPLPPYITETLKNSDRYQTVYAKILGSAAAPTAGLHFTSEILEKLNTKGVEIAEITLHIGLGTFRPVKTEYLNEHIMHSENYYISQESANLINNGKANGKRIVAVGTTSLRTLEAASTNDEILAGNGSTDIFIRPGYKFKCVDALITNFHLPESTLIMLISAFAGYDNTMNAYAEAIKNSYRFFSFGDAMFIH